MTVIALLFHSMAGYALARLRFPGREAIFLGMFATFLISLPVIIVPLFILVRQLGLVELLWRADHPGDLQRLRHIPAAPVLPERAARAGGGGVHRRRRLLAGLLEHRAAAVSRPILAALAIFFFLANWNAFLWPLTITTDPDLWVVQVAVASFQAQYSASWNYIMAASTVVALPTLLLFVLFQRQIIESIKTGGLK